MTWSDVLPTSTQTGSWLVGVVLLLARALVPLAVLVLLGLAFTWYLLTAARRLDRLHRRIESARWALSEQLLRRAQASTELASGAGLDPASAVLLRQAAFTAVDAGRDEAGRGLDQPFGSGLAGFGPAREDAESDLSRALRATLEELPADDRLRTGDALDDLAGVCFRLRLARRLYNDAVFSALQVRRGTVVRLFRLAGGAPLPRTFEIDDEPASVLSTSEVPGGH